MAGVSLTLLVLKTRQVDSVLAFYQMLGIEFTKEQHGKGPIHHAGLVGGVVIEVYPLPDEGTAVDASTRLEIAVSKLAEVVQAVEGIGSLVAKPPTQTGSGLQAVVKDPDGRSVELSQK